MPLNPLPLVVQGLTMLTGFLEKKKRERERIQSPGESYVQHQKKSNNGQSSCLVFGGEERVDLDSGVI